MNQHEFFQDPDVDQFAAFLASHLDTWSVAYLSAYKRIPAASRHFAAQGVEQAVNGYIWPSSFRAPLGAGDILTGDIVRCSDWNSTFQGLNYLRTGLRAALADPMADDGDVLRWTRAILDWGMGQRGDASQDWLETAPGGAKAYLSQTQNLLTLSQVDTAQLSAATIPYMSSGLSKVHALAAADGLVIFDSRVAAALGYCINCFLGTRDGLDAVIPCSLRLMRTAERSPPPVGHRLRNHPIFLRTYRWAETQVRVSWVLGEALRRRQDIFAGDPGNLRVHKLEAALFMFGAQFDGYKL